MEGSGSEVIFESLNLSPQLFINEVFNVVDDLLEEAFNYFLQEASILLKTEDTERSAELAKGVALIRNLIQMTLDQRLQKWEEYSLRFCFRVPEEFSLPTANESSGGDLPDIDAFADTELDAQLNSLRDKLTTVGKESAELGKELHSLERQSLSSNLSAGCIDEALQLYKKQNNTQMFQELTTMASEFRGKLGNLRRRRMEEIPCSKGTILPVRQCDMFGKNHGNGLFNARLEELEEFIDEITS